MDVQEFSKLKVDDVIRNEMSGSNGVIVEVESMGVRVRWLAGGSAPAPGVFPPTWFYSVQGTAWFHWSRVAQNDGDTAPSA
jgi:hypothetical protein